jgi:hypothetical protein
MDCALYTIDNVQHVLQLYAALYGGSDDTDPPPTAILKRSALHKPAKGPDGKPTMDAAAATKLRHDILHTFALNAEELGCNSSEESCNHIQVNNVTHFEKPARDYCTNYAMYLLHVVHTTLMRLL